MLLSISSFALLCPLLASALPAVHEARQVLMGYQTKCLKDTSMTFDDGPFIYETELVDELASYGAYSTFFVNGNNYDCIYDEAHVTSLRHAFESGHTIGSHTWSHYDITTGSTADLGRQLDLIEEALLKILGIKPALFRAPYGAINDEMTAFLNSRGYTAIGWTDDTGDTGGASVAAQITVLQTASAGKLFLAHETQQSTVQEVIPGAIPGLVAKGVKFVPVDQCLGISAYHGGWAGFGVRDDTWTCEGKPLPGKAQK